MADVSHELGSLRLIVDSPLSSKVAMFNNHAQQHQQTQLLNPFSGPDGRVSPKPQFAKGDYGKPLAGSLTESRGQKANIHVMKEMLELCQIIDSEGYKVKDEPTMRVIPFGELFNIYNYISDKVVGILLRARKYKLVEFEGEILFQRRDDDVPVFLLKPILEIRHILQDKIEEIKRAASPAPQATSVMMDKSAHMQKLKEQDAGLDVPKTRKVKSRTPSPSPSSSTTTSRAPTPTATPASSPLPETFAQEDQAKDILQKTVLSSAHPVQNKEQTTPEITVNAPPPTPENATTDLSLLSETGETTIVATNQLPEDEKADINNNNDGSERPLTPTIVIEATSEHVRQISTNPNVGEPVTAVEEVAVTENGV